MRVSVTTARRFSDSLLAVYAAESEAMVESALAQARRQIGVREGGGPLGKLLQEHAEHRRGQLRSNSPDTFPALAVLSVRERGVLRRITLGETDAEAGRELGISTRTVGKHIENILAKLGVETRTAAAAATFQAHGEP